MPMVPSPLCYGTDTDLPSASALTQDLGSDLSFMGKKSRTWAGHSAA